ncbi:MAG: NAD(P)/FAD-dependent oxidoreductase [Polyangiaceae bacterium]|nr:NAD(P)/FAD-dependent oxidoreductase [Myxococcales bacterium]MCB9586235.1 NAD(P)/FAD-dependent oxidoreductase [Polyangiaceae bacterium]MCB9606912.1 NAD(P)/FAD-dependent oxidoreductase [Polyangiaceae bacterium]
MSGGEASHEVVIIGSGFSGIALAIRLRQAGFDDFVLLERDRELGGTWRDNQYPGAACDVPAHLYSLSFEAKPDWSRAFATAPEIQDYVLSVVEKHGLRQRTLFGTRVVGLTYDETDGTWLIRTEGDAGERSLRARLVVVACGGLSNPRFPDIPGAESFAGKLFHTARWDHDFDLKGKRVAVIGTGASAIQVVPAIADQVGELCVFQRTPPWVFPRNDREFSEAQKRYFTEHPRARRWMRNTIFAVTELMSLGMVWRTPLRRVLERVCHEHRARQVPDLLLREKLTPNYPLGCKRMLLSDDYYPALCKSHVSVVTEPIVRVSPRGIITRDVRGRDLEREFDVLIAATGFDVPVDTPAFPVLGAAGRSLHTEWAQGAEAYFGVSIAGFPNLAMLMGPNTGPGHTSVLVYTEAEIERVLAMLRHMRAETLKSMDVRPEVQARFNRGVQARMRFTNWTAGCNSWYLTKHGKNTSLWPGFASEYVLRARRFSASDFNCER